LVTQQSLPTLAVQEACMLQTLVEYWQGIAAILLLSSVSSFLSFKLGLFVSIFITLTSIAFTIFAGTFAVTGYYEFVLFGLALFPAISWVGFFIGHFFRKKRNNNKLT
jgi:uncharacterized membrane protein YGL010W